MKKGFSTGLKVTVAFALAALGIQTYLDSRPDIQLKLNALSRSVCTEGTIYESTVYIGRQPFNFAYHLTTIYSNREGDTVFLNLPPGLPLKVGRLITKDGGNIMEGQSGQTTINLDSPTCPNTVERISVLRGSTDVRNIGVRVRRERLP